MTWFRSKVRFGSRIALLAMVVQFVLSFGHFHGVTSAATFAGGLSRVVADNQSARQPASNHRSGEHPDDICAICAVMAMANAALFATPPALPLPQIIEFPRLTAQREFARVASVCRAFQPRAPPIS